MQIDQVGPADAEPQPQRDNSEPPSELERLRRDCRRQALRIETLLEAVSTLSCGAKALKAENADLRAENHRLRGRRRDQQRVEGEELASVTIPLDVQAPGLARTVVVGCLAEHVVAPVLENAQLLVSELVTNSVRHSGAPEGDDLLLRVHLWRGRCRLEVEDQGRDGVIAPRLPDRAGGSGMGLNLVQMLSERWGVIRASDGPTRVWAQLPCGRAVV